MGPYGPLHHMQNNIGSIEDFVTLWNQDNLVLPENTHVLPAKQAYRLRPSSLGKSGYITAFYRLLNQFGKPHEAVNNARYYGVREDRFKMGHEAEARIVAVMREVGLAIDVSVPVDMTIAGYPIKGTADIVLGDMVLDVKTMTSSMYGGTYVPSTYRTQLGLYAKALRCTSAAILKFSKDTSELRVCPMDISGTYERVEYILGAIAVMDGLGDLEERIEYVFNVFEVTPPKPQVRLGKPTGRSLTPGDLHMDPLVRDILYRSEVSDGTRYITETYNVEKIARNIRNTYSE